MGGLKVGMSVAVACPAAYRPDSAVLDFAAGYGDQFLPVSYTHLDVYKRQADNSFSGASAFSGGIPAV